MKVPFSWLSEFLHVEELTPEEVAERLTLRSAETEVSTFGVELDGVVVGKVVEKKPHPSDSKLSVLTVQVHEHTFVKVVSADLTLKEGDRVLVALPHAKVGDRCITKREIKGVLSEGLLLSPQDLGLEEKSEGVLKVDEEVKPGTDAGEVLGFGEKVLELDITPNRGDLLSVRGVARELKALFGLKEKELKEPSFEEKGEVEVQVESAEDCPRYRALLVEGVEVKESPLFVKRRLWQCGMKPVNGPVDVTNYVMLRDGQPLHAFDADKIEGTVKVRRAKRGESFLGLDGKEYELNEEVLVIADAKKVLAVAGLLGGLESAVGASTRRILFESAYFNPFRVRKASKLLGIRTESSYRFERSTDVERVDEAQDYCADLTLRHFGGEVKAVKDYYLKPYEPRKIFLPLGKFIKYAGEPYDKEEASRILSALEIPHEVKRCGIEAEVPSHRSFDLFREVDLIEELMRVKGYESYPPQVLSLPALADEPKRTLEELKAFLRDRGLYEVVTLPFDEEEPYRLLGLPLPTLQVLNPLNPSQRFMRSSLLPSLLKVSQHNDRNYNYEQAFFEVGKVFSLEGEELALGLLLKGEGKKPEELSLLAEGLKSLLGAPLTRRRAELPFLHPYAGAELFLGDERVGFFGKLHPELAQAFRLRGEPLLMELKLEKLLGLKEKPLYRGLAKFPPAVRDVALLVDEDESVDKLLTEIKALGEGLVEELTVFDLYRGEKVGEGKKSVAIRIVFRSKEKSLTDEEVNELLERMLKALKEKTGATLRS